MFDQAAIESYKQAIPMDTSERACARKTCLTKPSKRTKCCTMFDQMFDGVQILSNTTKHDQTRSNNTKQGVQTGKCLVTKQCLIAFGRQTFPIWSGLKYHIWKREELTNRSIRNIFGFAEIFHTR